MHEPYFMNRLTPVRRGYDQPLNSLCLPALLHVSRQVRAESIRVFGDCAQLWGFCDMVRRHGRGAGGGGRCYRLRLEFKPKANRTWNQRYAPAVWLNPPLSMPQLVLQRFTYNLRDLFGNLHGIVIKLNRAKRQWRVSCYMSGGEWYELQGRWLESDLKERLEATEGVMAAGGLTLEQIAALMETTYIRYYRQSDLTGVR